MEINEQNIKFGEAEYQFVVRRAQRLLRQQGITAEQLLTGKETLCEDVTVIIPARNEELTIGAVVRECLHYVKNVIVVVGGSNDATQEMAEAAGAIVIDDPGLGKGGALRLGVERSTTPICVFVDADGSHDPIDIPMLVAPIQQGLAEHVAGSRLLGGSDELHGGWDEFLRLAGSAFITCLINLKYGVRLSDSQNGFRAIKTNVFKELELTSRHTTIEMEMITATLARGYRIMEIPTHELCRAAGYSKISLAHPMIWLTYGWHLIHGLLRNTPKSKDGGKSVIL